MNTAARRRQRILLRALYSGVLFVLARTFYLIITTDTTATTTTTTTDDHLIKYYAAVFHDLIFDGFLAVDSQTLAIGAHPTQYIIALKETGVTNSIFFPTTYHHRRRLQFPFQNDTFDLQFSAHTGLDSAPDPAGLSYELSRTLKPGGYLIVHTQSNDSYSLNSLLDLFDSFRLIRSIEIAHKHWSVPRIREIVLKKQNGILRRRRNLAGICSVPAYKKELIRKSEPLIVDEPEKPWIAFKKNFENVKYLTSMADIRFKTRYVYIDVGARSYGSSIGGWFKKQYPKQDMPFKIFAIEADKRYHEEYKSKKKITLLPYAAWVRNESLFFEINREPNRKNEEKGRGMGRAQSAQTSTTFMGDLNKIQGFDFASWVKASFKERDFVVVKMDVEGSEFDLVRTMIETGAICLIDEMFLECHYNGWLRYSKGERSSKYYKVYSECVELYTSLREKGVLVHQWWS